MLSDTCLEFAYVEHTHDERIEAAKKFLEDVIRYSEPSWEYDPLLTKMLRAVCKLFLSDHNDGNWRRLKHTAKTIGHYIDLHWINFSLMQNEPD